MNILITGGSGLLGKALTRQLRQQGHDVAWLGRKPASAVTSFIWNPEKGTIDPKALEWADAVVHLAGANVSEGRWTAQRKKEITESRVLSGQLLTKELQRTSKKLKAFISASAVGYYGMITADRIFTEQDPPHDDFFGKICSTWEQSVAPIQQLNIRTVLFRIGVVLSKEGGALPKMAMPVKWGVGAPLGTGRQWVPWIHIDDLVNMMCEALKNEKFSGVYNAVADEHITNRQLTEAIGKVLRRPVWMPAVPEFVLHAALGEMSGIVTKGSRVSNEKLKQTGFQLKFRNAEEALKDILI